MSADYSITSKDAREMLRRLYRSDGEINLEAVLRRAVSDPIKPVSEKGRMRPSTVVVASGVALFLILAGFMYFSFGGQR